MILWWSEVFENKPFSLAFSVVWAPLRSCPVLMDSLPMSDKWLSIHSLQSCLSWRHVSLQIYLMVFFGCYCVSFLLRLRQHTVFLLLLLIGTLNNFLLFSSGFFFSGEGDLSWVNYSGTEDSALCFEFYKQLLASFLLHRQQVFSLQSS